MKKCLFVFIIASLVILIDDYVKYESAEIKNILNNTNAKPDREFHFPLTIFDKDRRYRYKLSKTDFNIFRTHLQNSYNAKFSNIPSFQFPKTDIITDQTIFNNSSYIFFRHEKQYIWLIYIFTSETLYIGNWPI